MLDCALTTPHLRQRSIAPLLKDLRPLRIAIQYSLVEECAKSCSMQIRKYNPNKTIILPFNMMQHQLCQGFTLAKRLVARELRKMQHAFQMAIGVVGLDAGSQYRHRALTRLRPCGAILKIQGRGNIIILSITAIIRMRKTHRKRK